MQVLDESGGVDEFEAEVRRKKSQQQARNSPQDFGEQKNQRSPENNQEKKSANGTNLHSPPVSPTAHLKCVDSPSQRTRSKGILAINSVFLGQIFQTRSLKKVRAALHKYADKSGFTLGTSNKTDLSDTVKGRRLVMTCSLGGQSRKQKAVASTGDASALFKKKSKNRNEGIGAKG